MIWTKKMIVIMLVIEAYGFLVGRYVFQPVNCADICSISVNRIP